MLIIFWQLLLQFKSIFITFNGLLCIDSIEAFDRVQDRSALDNDCIKKLWITEFSSPSKPTSSLSSVIFPVLTDSMINVTLNDVHVDIRTIDGH